MGVYEKVKLSESNVNEGRKDQKNNAQKRKIPACSSVNFIKNKKNKKLFKINFTFAPILQIKAFI
jgi:hypothetical protein